MTKWTDEQLEAIIKDGQNIIVSAGAGSGKTAVLSERVIHKLNNGVHINELLILTFTRAAAEEMKNRIRKKIKKVPELSRELVLLDSAYITTFDSFALSVLKKYHYLLNLPKDIKITDDSIVAISKKKLLNETFLDYYKKGLLDFEEFVKKNCVKNDDVLRSSVAVLAQKLDGFIDKKEFLNFVKNEAFSDENINQRIEDYSKLIESKKDILRKELENLSYYFDEKFMLKIYDGVLPLLNTKNLSEFSSYNKISLPNAPRGCDEEAKNAKSEFKKCLDDLLSYTIFKDETEIKNKILSTQKDVYVIVGLLETYFEKLEKYKLENQIFTFGDVANFAIKILNENESVRNELKDSFKEIMIDEYQDTNDIQETFIGLISNNNVYMVGDIKQSIYRFRGSNPDIFKQKYEDYSKSVGGYKIDLIKNFRSREEVLAGINSIFDLVMDSYIGGAKYSESHEMVFGNQSYDLEKLQDYNYNFEVLEYENESVSDFSDSEIEIFTIARDIQSKINSNMKVFDKETGKMIDINYSDFVIILDRSKYFEDFKRIFEYLDIPLTILRDGELNSSIDLSIIKNIADFIVRIHEKDFGIEFKYDFMSIGRSFLYEYTDEYLFDVFTKNNYTETKLYNDFANIEDYNSKTCEELYRDILDITDFYNYIYKIGDYENINVRLSTISSMAKNLSSMGMTFKDFAVYLKEIVDNDYEIKYTMFNGGSNSVKILTIHKSKGLEYPICYFADLDHAFNISELKDKFILDRQFGIISPTDDEDDNRSVMKLLYSENFNKEEISEKIRLFYVALTRAREKMIMVLPYRDTMKYAKENNGVILNNKRLKFKSLSDIIYATKEYLQQHFSKIDISKIGLTKNYLYKKPLNSIISKDNVLEFEVKNVEIAEEKVIEKEFSKNLPELVSKTVTENMNFGTLIHEAFEYVDFKNFNPSIIENEFIRNKICKFLDNPYLKNIKDSNIYHEYEFTYQHENEFYHGIIDLLLEYDNHIDIIDFKLKNIGDEHYVKQLTGYKTYIQSLTHKKINLYLYSIIDERMDLLCV